MNTAGSLASDWRWWAAPSFEVAWKSAADQPAGRALRRRLAGVLADHDEPGDPGGPARGRPDGGGGRDPGPPGLGHEPAHEADGIPLPRGAREAGGYLERVQDPPPGTW